MPGQEVRGMLIRLEATTAQLRQEMAKADSTVAQVSGRIDSQLSRVDSAFERAGASAQAAANVLKRALAGVVGTAGISELLKHAEAYTTIANRLKLVTSGAAEFTAAQNAVFDIAQRSGQPLTATAELYQRIATNQRELKLTGQGVAGIVETISKTMVISGASTESANAALIQLGQAFASGTLRGEELNSVLEQAPALAQAIAKGMGVSVGALRSLGAAGKLTADSVVKALQAQAGAVNELFGKMQVTVSQGMTKLDNSATNLIGRLDQTSGVSLKLGGVLTSVSKSLDAVSADGTGLSKTAENVTGAVEKLAVIVGARLTLSLGQSVVAFLASAGAAIKQAAALTQSSIAADRAVRADAASAAQTLLTAQSRQVDAKAMLERANVELATAEQKVAADRVRQASDLANLQTVQAALVAERTLEEQRLRAQITEAGRAQSINRLVELRQAEVLIIDQVKAAEISLAQTSAATSAEIQAAYQRRAAAAGAYGETTLAVNEAVAASEKTSAAATGVSRTLAGVSAAGGGLLALLTGPVGILATIGLVAASFIDFGGSAKTATAALIDQNLTIDDSIAKFKELGEAQRTLQVSTWTEKQATALADVSAALNDYSLRGKEAFDQLGAAGIESGQAFARMLEEVRNGSRSLNSVTEWVKENKAILPSYTAMLEQTAAAYEINGVKADKYEKLLGQVSTATTSVTSETGKLAAAQQGTGPTTANRVAWDQYIQQLTKTRDLLGANAAAEAAYTAAKMGATPAQAAQAKIIADQTDVLKKYQEAIKQSAEADKARLRAQLVALYAAEDAANEAAAAQKKALDDTAKAAEDSATRQVNAMQLVINQAVNLTKGRNLLLLPDSPADKKNQTGYGLLTNGGTAPVAPVKPRATPDQRADAAVAQLDATTDANKRVDKAANAAATALKNQAKALQELLDKSGISTKASNEMADAYLGGADNVRALTIQQKIEEELLKTSAGARDKVTKAINDMQDAQDRADVAKHISEMRVEIDNLQKEAVATLKGQEAVDAFNVTKAVQAELIGKKIDVGSKEYEQLVATTKAQLDSNKALEQANEANSVVDRLYPQTKVLRDYRRELESLQKAMELDKDHADAYKDAIARLGVEYEQNQRSATAWGKFTEGAVDRIDSSFADAWKNIGKGFKGFSQSLVDGFKQLLAELAHMAITRPIIMQFASSLGIGGAAAQSAGFFGGGSSGSGLSAGSLLNGASSLYSAATGWGKALYTGFQSGGFSGAASGFGNYASGLLSGADQAAGQLAGTLANGSGMTYAPLSYQASSGALNGAAQGVATYAPWASAIGGAFMGYQNSGVKGAVAGAAGGYAGAQAGAAIGTYFMPVIGTAIGAVIGGLVGSIGGSKLFGGSWQTKDQGLSLGVTDGDLSAQQFEYQKKKGGLFGSNKKRTRYSPLDSDTQAALDDTYEATTGAVFDLFDKLNVTLNDGVLDGLNVSATQISTKGKTAEQIQEEIGKWFSGVADSVTSAINTATGTGLDGYNFQALTNFVNNLYSVNDIFTTLNLKLYDTSVSGGKLAESLSAAAGGLANLQAITSAYYDNFYTDVEKADNVLEAVRKQFKDQDIDFPGTREAFRTIVDGLDRTTEAGQEMFVTLTTLAGSAASAYSILEQRANAAKQALLNGAGASFSALERSINAQKASVNDMLATANTSVSDLTNVSTGLSNALKALHGNSDDAVKMLRKQALATLQAALAQARGGKSLAGFEGLSDALSTVSDNNTDLYSSLEDFNRDQGRTANVVAELQKLNGKQLSSAEQTVKTLGDQLKALDSQLEFAQQQLDALNGVDNSVKTVAQAVAAMNASVVAALAGIAGKATDASAATNGALVESVYGDVLGRPSDAAGKAYWVQQLANGSITYGQLAQAIANAAKANHQDVKAGYATGGLITGPGNGTSDSIVARLSNGEYIMTAAATRMFGTGLLDQMNAGRVPAFAAGGPVLDITAPGRIYSRPLSAAGTADAGRAAALEEKVDTLIDVVKQIMGPMKVDLNKNRKLFEKFDKEGLPPTRPTTASAT